MPSFTRDREDEWRCEHCGEWHYIQVGPPGMYCGCPGSRKADAVEADLQWRRDAERTQYLFGIPHSDRIKMTGEITIRFESPVDAESVAMTIQMAVTDLLATPAGTPMSDHDPIADTRWQGLLKINKLSQR